eukprot:1311413-Pyramimonas_sp.AAC.1
MKLFELRAVLRRGSADCRVHGLIMEMEMVTRCGEFSSFLPADQPAPWWADRVTDRPFADPEM